MGYFSYTIQANAGLPTGTQTRNVAEITFDDNPPIATDQVNDNDPSQGIDPTKQDLNTIDAGVPTSSVTALPTNSPAIFTVNWSGQDDTGGSGVAAYYVSVSDDGGPYTEWQIWNTGTSAVFTGQGGHTYSFYSVAVDNVGNTQSTPTAAQATTEVDATPPTSSVAALPSFSPASFMLNWSGSDNPGGSGLASYTIYVSDNSGTFQPVPSLTNTTQTSATFTGQAGHTYGFYSIATDNVGNVQPTPTTAQASTTVGETTISAVVVNQDLTALYNAAGQPSAGVQRSMVDDIVYTFSVPVNITAATTELNVFTIAYASGFAGTGLPTLSWAPVVGSNSTQWAVSFTGPNTQGGSVLNGEYVITVNDATAITAQSDSQALSLAASGIGGATQSFYRLFGDINGDEVVNNADNVHFKQALATFNPAFDVNNDGTVNNADNVRFKQSLSFSFSGFSPTI